MHDDWKISHKKVMDMFMDFIGTKTDLILKGGSALLYCYALDRFSEDLDFDAVETDILFFTKQFCNKYNYEFSIKKNTDTTKRIMVHYSDNLYKPLKIECSYRKKILNTNNITIINKTKTYTINELFAMKLLAYMGRDKLRDLYDITFINKKYYCALSNENKELLKNALSEKGLEHFDFLVENQNDDLINKDTLANDFLYMFNELSLLVDDHNKNERLK